MREKGSVSPRALVVLVLAVVLVVLLGVYFFGSSKTAPTAPTITTTTTTVGPTPTTSTMTTTAPPSAVQPSQSSFPAYAHLPYTGNGIIISLVNVAPDGKFILEVFSQTLTVTEEKAVYQAFLQSYGDPGTKYLPEFASQPTSTPSS
jgi:hypothetical protein